MRSHSRTSSFPIVSICSVSISVCGACGLWPVAIVCRVISLCVVKADSQAVLNCSHSLRRSACIFSSSRIRPVNSVSARCSPFSRAATYLTSQHSPAATPRWRLAIHQHRPVSCHECLQKFSSILTGIAHMQSPARLTYTRIVLGRIQPESSDLPLPCRTWTPPAPAVLLTADYKTSADIALGCSVIPKPTLVHWLPAAVPNKQ